MLDTPHCVVIWLLDFLDVVAPIFSLLQHVITHLAPVIRWANHRILPRRIKSSAIEGCPALYKAVTDLGTDHHSPANCQVPKSQYPSAIKKKLHQVFFSDLPIHGSAEARFKCPFKSWHRDHCVVLTRLTAPLTRSKNSYQPERSVSTPNQRTSSRAQGLPTFGRSSSKIHDPVRGRVRAGSAIFPIKV